MSIRLILLLTTLLVLCALSLVNSQHQARSLFIEFERIRTLNRQLDVEWTELQLAQSTLSQSARIENRAENNLNMVAPTAASTQYLILEP